MHFSSVFSREDTCSLSVPETKFNESEGERSGQLVVTPEVVANFASYKNSKRMAVNGMVKRLCKEEEV